MKALLPNLNKSTDLLSHDRRNFIKSGLLIGGALMGISPSNTTLSNNYLNANKDDYYRLLGSGSQQLKVSAVGLGCMGMSYHRSFIPDGDLMTKFIHDAYDYGVNFFDTAEAYGPNLNEILVGNSIKSFRKNIILATKFGFIQGKPSLGLDSHPKTIRLAVEESLKRLKTDYIDLLYQHRVDPKIPVEDVAGTVKELIHEGKVRCFGMSEASAANIRKAHAIQPLTALQSEYSLMTREPEQEVFEVCRALGIGFVPYSPLSRGLITGYINERTKYDASNDNRPTLPRYQKDNLITNWALIDILKEFGDHRGYTVAQVALAWMLNKEKWIIPIPGTTKLAHLKENLDAAAIQFTKEELHDLNSKVDAIKIVGDRYTGQSAEQVKK